MHSRLHVAVSLSLSSQQLHSALGISPVAALQSEFILTTNETHRADGDLAWQCEDLLQNRNEWWVPGKIVEIRRRLEHVWRVRCRTIPVAASLHDGGRSSA